LMLPVEVSLEQACVQFAAALNGSILPALNIEGGSTRLNGEFNPVENRITHCLFKDPLHPKAPRVRCQEQFIVRRAIRVRWIGEVLLDPGEVIFSIRDQGPALLFVRKTLPHERFVVCRRL